MLYWVYAVLSVCCTRCMLYSVYAVLGVCCTWYMLYLVYAVLGVNSWSLHGEIERDDSTSCSEVMVELRMRKIEMRGEGGRDIIMRDCDFREFCVRVNLKFRIWQVRVPIRCVITLIRGFPSQTRQVEPLICDMYSHSPRHSHLHPPSLSFSSTTQPSLQNTMLCHPFVSLHALITSWHWVQYTQSSASPQDCMCSLHAHNYELTPECSFSFQHSFLHDWPRSASCSGKFKGIITLSHSLGCKLTN